MNTTVRDRYLGDSVTTLSPQVLLVRLYERLVVDLDGAGHAIVAGDLSSTNELLGHAQDILMELRGTLDLDAWDGGAALAQLYDFCWAELVQANVTKDASRVAAVRHLVEPLCDAWREAALSLVATPADPSTGVSVRA